MPTPVKYESWQQYALNTGIDWDTATMKCMLLKSTYTPSAATHDFRDDLVEGTHEVTGSNYTAGGATLAGVAVGETSGTADVNFNDITWLQHASGFTDARYAVFYEDTAGASSTDPLVAYVDFTTDKGNQAGDLTLEIDAAGFFTQA